jgi:hypothetical protein
MSATSKATRRWMPAARKARSMEMRIPQPGGGFGVDGDERQVELALVQREGVAGAVAPVQLDLGLRVLRAELGDEPGHAEGTMCSRPAAAVKLPSSTTAVNAVRCRSSITPCQHDPR